MSLLDDQRAAEPIDAIYQDVESLLMQNIIRHCKDYKQPIATDEWLLKKLAEIGRLNQENIRIIAQHTGLSQTAIERLLNASAEQALKEVEPALSYLTRKGLAGETVAVAESTNVRQAMSSLQRQAKSTENLCNTTMLYKAKDAFRKFVSDVAANAEEIAGKQAFLDTLNKYASASVIGAESRQQAMQKCIREFNGRGIPAFVDKAGREWTPEAYVNMAMRNTVKNVADEVQSARCQDYGCNLIEIDSHSGARPKCARDQGKIYDLNNGSGYIEDGTGNKIRYYPWNTTGYGEPDGILGINCTHHKFPFWPGESLRSYFPTEDMEANDKLYKETQVQRALERDVRKQKRECILYDQIGDKKAFEESAVKLKSKEAKLKYYVDRNKNLYRRKDREQVVGFDKRVSAEAVSSAQKHYKEWSKSIGAESGPKNLAGYYSLKYNDNRESRLYKGYVSAVEKGRISPLVGYEKFKEVDRDVGVALDGITTASGQKVLGHTAHFVDRVIGTHDGLNQPASKELSKRLDHAAVRIDEAKATLLNGKAEDVKTDAKGRRSQRFIGKNCIVTLNPDTGELIQTNRKR